MSVAIELGERNPEGPLGPEAHTGLLGGVPPFLRSFFPFILQHLKFHFYIRVYAAAKPPGGASSDPCQKYFLKLFILYFINKNAAVKPPRAASSGPYQKIYIFLRRSRTTLLILVSFKIFYTSIMTELISHYFEIIYYPSLRRYVT
ncbi:MAG: hypothetical protein LBC53_10590 [Spirochaetaceae bacterium]|jgi:hypothetical protein|nr:hypothetical protein [Spirochaetaceae bacterium]